MGRVLTNNVGLSVTIESSVGVAGTSWFLLQPNTIGAYGAQITTRARRPLSPQRGRRKGAVIDLDSTVEFEADVTMDQFAYFVDGFLFGEFANAEFLLRDSGGAPTPTSTGYTIDAASALLAGKVVYASGEAISLVYGKGYATAANNGLKPLGADLGSTDTEVTVSGLTAEASPPANADLQVAGLRTEDVTVTVAANGTGTLVSAGDISDWSTYGLLPGQLLHIGGVDTSSATLPVANAPTISAATAFGYVRVVSISGATLNFDKATGSLLDNAAASSGSETIDFLFGRFTRNVAVSSDSDDERYLERTYQFEVAYPGLASNGTGTEYEYAIGNFANELTLNLPLGDLATMSFGFIGTNSDDITGTRKSGASSAVESLRETGFSSAVSLASITTDVISSASDVCFKSATVTFLNNVSPEKCLGTLGATFVNAGLFEVNIEGQLAFTSASIINAIKNNTTVTMQFILENEDGAMGIDVPEMTLGGGGREFPVDQTVLVNLTGESFTSNTYGHDAGVSLFPVVPLAAA